MEENKRSFLNIANILVVYESDDNINSLIKILDREGYNNIDKTLNNEYALEVMKENIPDLILIYLNMNDSNAYEICKNVKTTDELKEIPIIFVSEYKNIDKKRVFEAGGADYLTIPFNCEEVKKRIEMHLKFRFMELELKKSQNKPSYNELINLNEDLKNINKKLEGEVLQKNQELEDITLELKEFNVLLEEEITERTKTEEALEESERQFRFSIEEAPLPVMLYNDDGKIKKINRVWKNISGYTINDMPVISEWAHISDAFKMDLFDPDICNDLNFETRHNKGEFSVKTRFEGIRFWNFYSACIGEIKDGHKLFVMLAIDVTERKHMEQLRKSIEEDRKKVYEIKEYDKIRTEFFANISHELRTPINVIFSALQMFELSLKDSQTKNGTIDKYKYTKIMKQNCYRILRLINNIIDITKIDSGYFDISKENIDIVSLIENITLSVADYIENKGLSLIFDTYIEEKIIACDPEKMERIILNLLSNSVKFTPSGGKIVVSIEECSENICIKVKDTGRGIPKEKLNAIFERFVQVDKSLTRDHEGSGIGLSIVKSLVGMHGGTISVKSDVDKGTEFIIYIPCKMIEETSKESLLSNSIGKSNMEKINIEFSDI